MKADWLFGRSDYMEEHCIGKISLAKVKVQCEETYRCGHRGCPHYGPHDPKRHCDGSKENDFGAPVGCTAGKCIPMEDSDTIS